MSSVICFSLDQSKILSSGNDLKHNPKFFTNLYKAGFWIQASIFSFSHNVFLPYQKQISY